MRLRPLGIREIGRCLKPFLILALILSGVVACAAKVQPEVGGPVTRSGVRQVDDAGKKLPFETDHQRRWNRANDGTPYEPCTALTDGELYDNGVDARSTRDAAGTDGQTLRGCRWKFMVRNNDRGWSVSQFVANSPSLAADKQRYSLADDIWLQDAVLDGRTVGIHRTATLSDCDTYVQSGAAGVHTLVMYIGPTPPPPSEICDRAIAFTRATISKMPL
ncbi:DUF3558 family protein [Gordonia aichiensis]|uniref:DUF3558 family protein n=1 Tax=Gordonia aichiensis TaxID=36820 RepID=UPI003D7682A3